MNQPITLLKPQKKIRKKMSTKIADTFPCFLFPVIKTFAINMFWLNFYQIAYIDKLIVFPSISPFPRSASAESNSESGIFTNILHSK